MNIQYMYFLYMVLDTYIYLWGNCPGTVLCTLLDCMIKVPLGTPSLRSAAMHLGKYCEVQNNEFMLCRSETQDPRYYKL